MSLRTRRDGLIMMNPPIEQDLDDVIEDSGLVGRRTVNTWLSCCKFVRVNAKFYHCIFSINIIIYHYLSVDLDYQQCAKLIIHW